MRRGFNSVVNRSWSGDVRRHSLGFALVSRARISLGNTKPPTSIWISSFYPNVNILSQQGPTRHVPHNGASMAPPHRPRRSLQHPSHLVSGQSFRTRQSRPLNRTIQHHRCLYRPMAKDVFRVHRRKRCMQSPILLPSSQRRSLGRHHNRLWHRHRLCG